MARRRQFGTSQRRRVGWSDGPGDISTFAAVTASSVAIVGNGAIALGDGITVVRIRGILQLILTAASAPLDGFTGAFGICVVTEDAFAVGVTAVPDPVDDVGWDGWMWHSFYSLIQPIAFAAQSAATSNQTLVIDTKAMRKLHASDVIILVGEHLESGTAAMIVVGGSRALTKLA